MLPSDVYPCDKDCRFQFSNSMRTCLYYEPVYDKAGNNLNPDANTATSECKCTNCGKNWISATKLGVTTFTPIEQEPK